MTGIIWGRHSSCDSEFQRIQLDFLYNKKLEKLRLETMKLKAILLLSGFASKFSAAEFIKFDSELEPELINQNQVFLNRKERFIKFDTKDNELEIELGISIPFIKVPLTSMHNKRDSNISVNAPGLIVAGMLMLTSFIIIPFLFASTSEQGFGFQRKEKEDLWSYMGDINDVLFRNGIDSSTCMQKSICWIAKTSKEGKDGSIGKWINYLLRTWWMNRLIGGTIVEDAVETASNGDSCAAKYPHCSLTNRHLQSFVKMIAARHS